MEMSKTDAAASVWILLHLFAFSALPDVVESGIGVNWGTVSLHNLSPSTVVNLLIDNKIAKVKLFDADPNVLKALMGTQIQVMVGIPNEMLALLSSSTAAADLWVSQNVSRYMIKSGVNIKYVCSSPPLLRSFLVKVIIPPIPHPIHPLFFFHQIAYSSKKHGFRLGKRFPHNFLLLYNF